MCRITGVKCELITHCATVSPSGLRTRRSCSKDCHPMRPENRVSVIRCEGPISLKPFVCGLDRDTHFLVVRRVACSIELSQFVAHSLTMVRIYGERKGEPCSPHEQYLVPL